MRGKLDPQCSCLPVKICPGCVMKLLEDVLLCFTLPGRSYSVEPLLAGSGMMFGAPSKVFTLPSNALTGIPLVSSTMLREETLQPAPEVLPIPEKGRD